MGVSAIATGADGVIWAVTGSDLRFLPPGDGNATTNWEEYQFCSSSSDQATDILVSSGSLMISTEANGVYVINYNLSSNQSIVGIQSIDRWDSGNFLASNRITDLQMMGNQLLISTENAGISRRDMSTSTWLSRWSTGNALASNNIVKFQYLMVGYTFLQVTHFQSRNLNRVFELRKPCKVLDCWITQFRFHHGPLALVSEDLVLGCQF